MLSSCRPGLARFTVPVLPSFCPLPPSLPSFARVAPRLCFPFLCLFLLHPFVIYSISRLHRGVARALRSHLPALLLCPLCSTFPLSAWLSPRLRARRFCRALFGFCLWRQPPLCASLGLAYRLSLYFSPSSAFLHRSCVALSPSASFPSFDAFLPTIPVLLLTFSCSSLLVHVCLPLFALLRFVCFAYSSPFFWRICSSSPSVFSPPGRRRPRALPGRFLPRPRLFRRSSPPPSVRRVPVCARILWGSRLRAAALPDFCGGASGQGVTIAFVGRVAGLPLLGLAGFLPAFGDTFEGLLPLLPISLLNLPGSLA